MALVPRSERLPRVLPALVTVLGVIHLVYAVVESPDVLGAMVRDGLWGAADDHQRDYVTWFVIAGFALLLIGSVLRWTVRTTGRVPASAGWWMILIGAFDAILEPVGGGWLILALGILTVVAARTPQPA